MIVYAGASAYQIAIAPEIDMSGHMQAAIGSLTRRINRTFYDGGNKLKQKK